MVIQYGYVTLFAGAFPLSAMLAVLCNIVELKSDLFKLTHVTQKPASTMTKDIGIKFIHTLIHSLTHSLTHSLIHPLDFDIHFDTLFETLFDTLIDELFLHPLNFGTHFDTFVDTL